MYNHENFIELLDNRLYGEAWTMWDKGLTQQEINREFDTIPRWDGSDLTGKNRSLFFLSFNFNCINLSECS